MFKRRFSVDSPNVNGFVDLQIDLTMDNTDEHTASVFIHGCGIKDNFSVHGMDAFQAFYIAIKITKRILLGKFVNCKEIFWINPEAGIELYCEQLDDSDI